MDELTNEQLCVLAQNGDSAAQELLISQNRGFVRLKASQICENYPNYNYELEDMEQECCAAITAAVNSFDPTRGIKFITYAAAIFDHEMQKHIRKRSKSVEVNAAVEPLDAPERIERKAESLWENYDEYSLSPERIFIMLETLYELRYGFNQLSPRKQQYIKYRYGLWDGCGKSLVETAEHFHLRESSAKRLERSAMDDLWLELLWWYSGYSCTKRLSSITESTEISVEVMDDLPKKDDLEWDTVCAFIHKNGSIASADVCRMLSVSTATANRKLKGWAEAKKLERYMNGKAAAYRLADKDSDTLPMWDDDIFMDI